MIEDGTVRFAAARVKMEGQVIGPRGSKGEHCSLLNHPIACRVRWYEAFEMLPPAMMGRDPGVNQNFLATAPTPRSPSELPVFARGRIGWGIADARIRELKAIRRQYCDPYECRVGRRAGGGRIQAGS